MTPADLLRQALDARLSEDARRALDAATREIQGGVPSTRFGTLFSGLSRSVKARPLDPADELVDRGLELLPDWSIERWNTLEAARVTLVLAMPELAGDRAAEALEDAFVFADEGETCALAKALPLLPEPGRFVWRAGECCRSNMVSVFESAACDSPYAVTYFDDVAWRQAVIKAVFVGAPMWRIRGLDRRLDDVLAQMALDLVEERRSAGRPIPIDLWLCLGEHGGDRALPALEAELPNSGPSQRGAVGLALARRGDSDRVAALAGAESDPGVAPILSDAATGTCGQDVYRRLHDLAAAGVPG